MSFRSDDSDKNENRLKKIKSSVLSRGLALAKVSVSAGARVATHAVGTIFSNESDKAESYKELLISQVEALTRELGQLKGSLMKVGQLLSMHGEHFLPPEANALLKSLQNQSPPLDWKEMEKVFKRQLTEEQLNSVEIHSKPIASASLGQVYRAVRKEDGRALAMKVQYPGVDRAIEGDLKAMRSILSFSKLIPKGPKYDELFHEVRAMLHQEVDYARELELTQDFRNLLKNDSRYIVPEPILNLSTRRILTTSFEEGFAVDSPEVLGLSQERRNSLGVAFLDLYFRELFEFGQVQTDPHFGNYRVRLGTGENAGMSFSATSGTIPLNQAPGATDRLVLFDFGAVRKFPESFRKPYLEMLRGAMKRDVDQVIRGASGLNFIREEDSLELKKSFADLCFLITEPFHSKPPSAPSGDTSEDSEVGIRSDLFESDGSYRWGDSDLSKRVARKGTELAMAFRLRPPPREIVFLDRKMGGIFVILSVLKVCIKSRDVIERYI